MVMDWEKRFRDGQTPWLRSGVNPAFEAWFKGPGALSLRGAKMLVPGFGTAPESLEAAKLGALVTGIDIAPTAVAFQQARFAEAGLDGTFTLGDIATWRPSEPFDLIYEQTCLCAIEPAERTAYEALAAASLKPGGRLHALFMQNSVRPGGPPFHCDLAEMRALFHPARWAWPSTPPIRADHDSLGMFELGFVLNRLPQLAARDELSS